MNGFISNKLWHRGEKQLGVTFSSRLYFVGKIVNNIVKISLFNRKGLLVVVLQTNLPHIPWMARLQMTMLV